MHSEKSFAELKGNKKNKFYFTDVFVSWIILKNLMNIKINKEIK